MKSSEVATKNRAGIRASFSGLPLEWCAWRGLTEGAVCLYRRCGVIGGGASVGQQWRWGDKGVNWAAVMD